MFQPERNFNMTANGILQIFVYLVLLTLLAKPMGVYLTKVYAGERTLLSFVCKPLERSFFAIARVDATSEMNWKQYGVAMLVFSLMSSIVLFAVLPQFYLPFNPQQMPGVSADSSFNTAVSFVTNTNWQGYAGEATMSYFTQMAGLAIQNFASAAV